MGAIRVFADDFPSMARVSEFRQAARIDADKDNRHPINLPCSTQPSSAAPSIRASDIADSAIEGDQGRASADIYLDAGFDKAGPMERDLAPTAAEVSSAKMFRFSRFRVKAQLYSPIARISQFRYVRNITLYIVSRLVINRLFLAPRKSIKSTGRCFASMAKRLPCIYRFSDKPVRFSEYIHPGIPIPPGGGYGDLTRPG